MRFVIARSISKRPTLQHRVSTAGATLCGQDMIGWSRAYQTKEIPQIACLNCQRVRESQINHRLVGRVLSGGPGKREANVYFI